MPDKPTAYDDLLAACKDAATVLNKFLSAKPDEAWPWTACRRARDNAWEAIERAESEAKDAH